MLPVSIESSLSSKLATETWFSSLTPQELKRLIASGSSLQLNAGELLFRAGDSTDALFHVVSGCIQIHVATLSGTILLNSYEAGDIFGEIAALTGQRRTANIIINRETHLLRVPARTLCQLMEHPHIKAAIYSKMNERLDRLLLFRPGILAMPRA